MKIKASKLGNFVRKASLNAYIYEGLYKANSDGLLSINKDSCSMALTNCLLLKKAFVEFEGTEILAIRSNKRFMDLLNLYGDAEVVVTVENNVLLIEGKSSNGELLRSEMKTVDADFIESALKEFPPTLKFDWTPVKMDSQVLVSAKSHLELLKQNIIFLGVKDNQLTITAGEDKFDRLTQKQELVHEDFMIRFGSTLQDVVGVLDGKIEAHFKTDYPALFTEKTEDYEFKVVLAPFVDK